MGKIGKRIDLEKNKKPMEYLRYITCTTLIPGLLDAHFREKRNLNITKKNDKTNQVILIKNINCGANCTLHTDLLWTFSSALYLNEIHLNVSVTPIPEAAHVNTNTVVYSTRITP